MDSNPLSLAVRFALELSVLVALGVWAWRHGDGGTAAALAVGLPLYLSPSWAANSVGRAPPLHGRPRRRASPRNAGNEAMHESASCNQICNLRSRDRLWSPRSLGSQAPQSAASTLRASGYLDQRPSGRRGRSGRSDTRDRSERAQESIVGEDRPSGRSVSDRAQLQKMTVRIAKEAADLRTPVVRRREERGPT